MYLQIISNVPDDVVGDVFSGLENWCIAFNEFCLIFFQYLKYIFVFILFSLGILTLLKLRRIYFDKKINKKDDEPDNLKKERYLLGIIYIFLALGILFNFLIYFLMICLDPLPDRLVFNFINFNGDIDPYYMNRIQDINAAKYPHEKTIYYCIAYGSCIAFLQLTMCFWYFLNNRSVDKPKATLIWLISSVSECILFGFTTFLPFFL